MDGILAKFWTPSTPVSRSRIALSLWTRNPRDRPRGQQTKRPHQGECDRDTSWDTRKLVCCNAIRNHVSAEKRCATMTLGTNGATSDANDRRRLSAEAFMHREQEVWRLHLQGWTVRAIARELGCPRTTVQKMTKERTNYERFIESVGGVDVNGDKLDADLLELFQARHAHPVGSAERAAAAQRLKVAADAYWAARGRPEQVDGKVDDGMSLGGWCGGRAVRRFRRGRGRR